MPECDVRFFKGYSNPEVKTDMLAAAIEIAKTERIGLSYALNIERGLYGVQEARRRMNARLRESRAPGSTDIFIVGKRRPGSFK